MTLNKHLASTILAAVFLLASAPGYSQTPAFSETWGPNAAADETFSASSTGVVSFADNAWAYVSEQNAGAVMLHNPGGTLNSRALDETESGGGPTANTSVFTSVASSDTRIGDVGSIVLKASFQPTLAANAQGARQMFAEYASADGQLYYTVSIDLQTNNAYDFEMGVTGSPGNLTTLNIVGLTSPTLPHSYETVTTFTKLGSVTQVNYLIFDNNAGVRTLCASGTGIINATLGDDVVLDRAAVMFQRRAGGAVDDFSIGVNPVISKPVDATMDWSTFLGGSNNGYGSAVAVDASGNVYVAGKTNSGDFPTTNAFDSGHAVDAIYGSAFVMKISPAGKQLWATYLGDTGEDEATAIAVDSSGVYVVGETNSSSFDLLNAQDSTLGGWCDAFVTKISLGGTLLWSTYLGGSDYDAARAVALSPAGDVYVGGMTRSGDSPCLNAYDSTAGSGLDGFVTKFNSNGVLQWSTYFGGNGATESVDAMAAITSGIVVCGTTDSTDFPTSDAYDATANGSSDIFVAKFSAAGALLDSTYLGGSSYDACGGCATDAAGAIYIAGRTMSTDFPVPNAQYPAHAGGDWDTVVAKLTSPGALAWATYLGGADADGAAAIACKGADVLMAGYTWSSNLPLTAGSGTTYGGLSDAFLARANANGTVTWTRYLGGASYDLPSGVAIGVGGKVAVTGYTQSTGFPTPGGFDTSHNGKVEGFATQYSTPLSNSPPSFNSDPFTKNDATKGVNYSESIAGDASDLDAGDSLTFSRVSGPLWLSVAGDGALPGTPGSGDVGLNQFSVCVSDTAGATDGATMNITVRDAHNPGSLANRWMLY